jgi:heptosyltransferase-2
MNRSDCRLYTGYKPCRHRRPCEGCPHFEPYGPDVLIVFLDALGDVLRGTSLLAPLRRRWPEARVTWLTRPRALPLLVGQPLLDEALPFDLESVIALEARRFDLLLCADKSRLSGALARRFQATEKRGFGVDERGAIVPLGPEAEELHAQGLDDLEKFQRNERSMPELLTRAMGLEWARDPYRFFLRPEERSPSPRRRVGFNTGASANCAMKALDPRLQEEAARRVVARTGEPVLLLGGPEDRERNEFLAARLGPLAELGPTDLGLRAGAAEVDRCEVVFSGDSLGMHLAIALEKHVVAWFGPTCPQEIDLFDRGIHLLADVDCAPCWRRACDRSPTCGERLSPDDIADAVMDVLTVRERGQPLNAWRGGTWWRPRPTR